MSYEFYKVLHIGSILFLFTALGGAAFLGGQGVAKGTPARKFTSILHGTGLLIALVAGFGLLARLGMVGASFPLWVWAKLAIWLVMGGSLAIAFRKGECSRTWAIVFPLLGMLAAWFAVMKPGQ